jgi:hypothetical protein
MMVARYEVPGSHEKHGPLFQALRTWLPSFCPFRDKYSQHLSTNSAPHHG